MTNREFLRRFLQACWIALLVFFALAWWAGTGWVGPGYAYVTWTIPALPCFVATAFLASGRAALKDREARLVILTWIALLVMIYIPVESNVDESLAYNSLTFFWVLVAAYTVVPLWVTSRASRILEAAKPSGTPSPGARPWKAVGAISATGVVAACVLVYQSTRPEYTFRIRTQENATARLVETIWQTALSRETADGLRPIPHFQSYARVGTHEIQVRLRKGVSTREVRQLLHQLERHPAVATVDTTRN
jgi:hypothetical protein